MRRLTGPDGLRWTVKRLVLPNAMRPLSPLETLEAATPRRTVVDGMADRVPDAIAGVTGPLPLAFVLVPFLLPFVPAVLLLRRLRLLPWTVEARAYPWGRRFPPIVLAYAIRGGDEAKRALDELVEALARGDGAPVLAGAEWIGAARGSDRRPMFGGTARKLYGRR